MMKIILRSQRYAFLALFPVLLPSMIHAQCIPVPKWDTRFGGLENIADPLTAQHVIVRPDGDGTNHFYADRSTGSNFGEYAKGRANYVTAYGEGYVWAEDGGRGNASVDASGLMHHTFYTDCQPYGTHIAPPNGMAQHLKFAVNYQRYLVRGRGPAEKRISIRSFVRDINGFSTLAQGDYEHPNAADDILIWAIEGNAQHLGDGVLPQIDTQYDLVDSPEQDFIVGSIPRRSLFGQILEFDFHIQEGGNDMAENQYIQWSSLQVDDTFCHSRKLKETEAAEIEVNASVDSAQGTSEYSFLQFETKAGTRSAVLQQPVFTCGFLIDDAGQIRLVRGQINEPWVLGKNVGKNWRGRIRKDATPGANEPSVVGGGLERKATTLPSNGNSVGQSEAAWHIHIQGLANSKPQRLYFRIDQDSSRRLAFDGRATASRLDGTKLGTKILFNPLGYVDLPVGYWKISTPVQVLETGFGKVAASTDPSFMKKDAVAYAGIECMDSPFTVKDWEFGAHTGIIKETNLEVELWGSTDSFVYFVPLRKDRWQGLSPMTLVSYKVTSSSQGLKWDIAPQVNYSEDRDSWFIAALPTGPVDIEVTVQQGGHELMVPISFPEGGMISAAGH